MPDANLWHYQARLVRVVDGDTQIYVAVAGMDGTGWPLLLVTRKADDTEKFGRWLATIYRRDDLVSLNDALVAAGHAVPYLV